MHLQRSLWVGLVSILLAVSADHAVGNPAGRSCPKGEYYVRALDGYVLLPAQYMPYAFDLEPGITGAYESPSPPMALGCNREQLVLGAGNIHTGTLEAIVRMSGQLPKSKPTSRNRVGEFEVTIWALSQGRDPPRKWWTVLISRNDQAMRIFAADPELWRRILDSYTEL